MTFITTIANQLNKPTSDILELCNKYQIEVHYDQDGEWIYDDQAKRLLRQEYEMPTRYNFRGVPCRDIQEAILGDSMQAAWMFNVLKYIYRAGSVGDLEKAKTYLQFIIDDAKEKGLRY